MCNFNTNFKGMLNKNTSKVKGFFTNNKKKIIGGVALIAVGITAVAAYKHYNQVMNIVEPTEDMELLNIDDLNMES